MFHTKVRTKAAFAELGHDVFQTSQALRNRKKEVSTSWVKSTPRTNCWGKHKTYEHKELLPAFAVEGLLPYKQSSFGPLRHCFESYITIDQEAWFLIYVLSLCYVMLHHKNTPSVFIDCSSGLPVAKAATVRRKKSMELEASWSSHKFWAWPMGFPIRFDGNRIRCHTCSFPCEISIFSNKAPWQSVISESFNSSPTNLFAPRGQNPSEFSSLPRHLSCGWVEEWRIRCPENSRPFLGWSHPRVRIMSWWEQNTPIRTYTKC